MSVPGYLIDVHLGGIEFARRDDWEPDSVQYAVVSEIGAELANDRASVKATLAAEINWHRPGDDGEQVEGPFDLSIDVVGVFSWAEPDQTDEDIVGWVEFNAQHLLWPYLRSYASTITAASGLPVLTLFTISVPYPALGGLDDRQLEAEEVPPEQLTS